MIDNSCAIHIIIISHTDEIESNEDLYQTTLITQRWSDEMDHNMIGLLLHHDFHRQKSNLAQVKMTCGTVAIIGLLILMNCWLWLCWGVISISTVKLRRWVILTT